MNCLAARAAATSSAGCSAESDLPARAIEMSLQRWSIRRVRSRMPTSRGSMGAAVEQQVLVHFVGDGDDVVFGCTAGRFEVAVRRNGAGRIAR